MYKEFKEKIKEELRKSVGESLKIEDKEVTKKNDVVSDGIAIVKHNNAVAPCIYLNDYYKQYQSERRIQEIVEEILKVYSKSSEKVEEQLKASINFNDFSAVKDKIYIRLVNADMNKKLLETIPHKHFLDLVVTYAYLYNDNEDEIGSVTILNEMFKSWNCIIEELHEIAIINTMRMFPSQIRYMETILAEFLGATSEVLLSCPTCRELMVQVH